MSLPIDWSVNQEGPQDTELGAPSGGFRHVPCAAPHAALPWVAMLPIALSLSTGEGGLSRLASGAKSKIGYAGKFIADQAVQLHGGMGMTDELNVGHYFKRISSINIQFGDPAFHVLRFAQLDAAA